VLGGIPGPPPDLSLDEPGCPFTARCSEAIDICHRVDPPLTPLRAGLVACHVRASEVGTESAETTESGAGKELRHGR
jgi:ABC-type dipeptide/oligopeptide/nickel transport system ATPase component